MSPSGLVHPQGLAPPLRIPGSTTYNVTSLYPIKQMLQSSCFILTYFFNKCCKFMIRACVLFYDVESQVYIGGQSENLK